MKAADHVAVVSRLGDLESATPLPAEATAHLDRGSGREDRCGGVIGETFHNFSSLAKDSSDLVTQISRWVRSSAVGTTRPEAITSARVVDINHAPPCQVAGSDGSTPRRDAGSTIANLVRLRAGTGFDD